MCPDFFPPNLPLISLIWWSLLLVREETTGRAYSSLTIRDFYDFHGIPSQFFFRPVFVHTHSHGLTLLTLLTPPCDFPIPVSLFWTVRVIKALPRSCYRILLLEDRTKSKTYLWFLNELESRTKTMSFLIQQSCSKLPGPSLHKEESQVLVTPLPLPSPDDSLWQDER